MNGAADITGRDPADLTLDEVRAHLAPLIAEAAAFDGWSDAALAEAAGQAGIDREIARLAFAGDAAAMIAAWIATIDASMQEALTPSMLSEKPIRERIRSLIQFRLDAMAGREEAVRRALAIFAMPQNIRAALRSGWSSADAMWRLAGDTATDYNHYTKRAILASIYAATLAVWVDDDSADKAETRAFLARRIDGVMRFEKAKAKWLSSDRDHFSMARFLGRLRYPAR